ncbi:DMT family transporter [Falsirhodobacter sp. alg1]|uniref:DMT family transporter n=1 Tax=Falsirhodobacter sp. alg1 TaxID=1472418 RepID=UPI001EDBC1FD|nr:DMT family transporter [Falsirhodobacter sp. alg1]
MQGIAAILLAVFLLSFSDGLVKLIGARFGLGQLVLLRSLVAVGLLGGAMLVFARAEVSMFRHSGWVWARSLCLAAMWLCYYAALPSMSFALAAACYYTTPVWMALMSRLMLGTVISRRRWGAIFLTMAGVILVVDPDPESLSPVLLLPLAAAGFYALSGIITWRKCQQETPGVMALNLNLCLCILSGLGMIGLGILRPEGATGFVMAVWPVLEPADWLLVACLGGLLAIISVAVAMAYRLAPTPVVGMFDTAYLAFAALWGGVLFGAVPAYHEVAGMAVIAAGVVLASGGRVPRRSPHSMVPVLPGGMHRGV